MNFITKNIKYISFAVCLLVIASIFIYSEYTKPQTHTFYAFDTFVSLTLYGKNAKNASAEAEQMMIRLENEFSMYRSGSYTFLINNAEINSPVKVSGEYAALLKKSVELCRKSHGAFDISVAPLSALWDVKNRTVPPGAAEIAAAAAKLGCDKLEITDDSVTKKADVKIDLGGIAKGYAADRLKETVKSAGVSKGILNLGGNVCVIGGKSPSKDWTVGITDPFDTSKIYTDVKVRDTSVITSGGYQRYFEYNSKIYHHIISPYTGYPAESDLASATVIYDDATAGDALSTAVFVLGSSEGEKLLREFNAGGVLIKCDGTVINIP